MPRLVEVAICLFAQCVAVLGILIGLGYVAPLLTYASSAIQGQPWQGGELARLIALVCGPVLLGLLAFVGLTWHLWSSRALRQRKQEYPEQPWMWQPDWAGKSIRLSNRAALWVTLISSALYGLVVTPLGIYLASLKNATLVYSFVGAVGCFLLIFFRLLWVNHRWNRSCMQLETLPGVIGGRFEGMVTIPESIPEGTVLRVTLRCDMTRSARTSPDARKDLVDLAIGIERSRNGSSSLQTETLYEDSRLFTVTRPSLASAATVLPVSFQIPGGLPSSGKQPPPSSDDRPLRTRINDHCNWRVRVKPEQTSDLREILFEVPIFNLGNDAVSKRDRG
jgi:MFS family permease